MWTCFRCTFLNHGEIDACEMCETKRGQPIPDNLSSSSGSRGQSSPRKFFGKWSNENGDVVITIYEYEGRVFVNLNDCVDRVEATTNNGEDFLSVAPP